ncbi:hypothetical protein Gogos_013831 [Gossypium gossypioides]|uniref:MATH domain-containing protein n=1 Tax=Gossypium gossypioides TaxID=34282 RepID=A0A7J9BWX1_GOSGO|nr:hypothetical protein [Gossypium gossypioides]
MAGIASEDCGVGRYAEGISSGQHCQTGEALAEWQSSEQVENGTPSTSLLYWDSDDGNDGGMPLDPFHVWLAFNFSESIVLLLFDLCNVSDGPKPSELYGKYTWKIEKFSQINKRELRSNAFEVGGYKWYILIYPQGCDVCNHLSLFLCVANHDKLLPGWSHFAQFTIAVVNKDPKKSKYSDTLHRFWKKEHDWGWKKFMELSKVYDGFIESDTLIIKAQVQVIREKADRPFRCLDCQYRRELVRSKLLDTEEMPAPIVHVEKDMFVLVDDVLLLLERAALEPLPPKDEKGQCLSKLKFSLTHRTLSYFLVDYVDIISNKIEVAYQEAVALQRQEELIREEAAWLAESEQKTKRGASEKEKKAKKKQAKQKRNNRKSKDKGREKVIVAVEEKQPENHLDHEKEVPIMAELQHVPEKSDVLGDVSDVSDSVDGAAEVLQPDSEDRDACPVNWDTDTSEIHPPTEASSSGINGLSCVRNGVADRRSTFIMDDSSSTCSTDSVRSVVMNGHYKGNSFSNNQNKRSPNRGKDQRRKTSTDGSGWTVETNSRPSCPRLDAGERNDVSESSKAGESESVATVSSLPDQTKWVEQDSVKKEEVDLERPKEKTAAMSSSPSGLPGNLSPTVQFKSEYRSAGNLDSMPVRKATTTSLQQSDQPASSSTSFQMAGISKSEIQKAAAPKPTEKLMTSQVPVMSRPSSAPLVPGPRPTTLVSTVQTTPFLARSVSAAGRLGPDPSPATSYVPQSYRNAIMGNHVSSSSAGFTHPNSCSSGVNSLPAYSQPPALVSAPVYIPHSPDRIEPNSVQSGFPFGMVTRDTLPSAPQWLESSRRDGSRSTHSDPSLLSEIQNLDLYKSERNETQEHFFAELPACTSGYHSQGVLADEFPHLDIINDLLDEENNVGRAVRVGTGFRSLGNCSHLFHRQFSFPSNLGMSGEMGSSNGACRFDRARSFHDDGFRQGYSTSSDNHFDTLREFIPHANPLPYVNGQIDGLVPTQWLTPSSDPSLLGMRNTDVDSYPYYNQDYSNLACGINGYTVFRPSNGY